MTVHTLQWLQRKMGNMHLSEKKIALVAFHSISGLVLLVVLSYLLINKKMWSFFFPNQSVVHRYYLLSPTQGTISNILSPHPCHISKTSREPHWAEEAFFRLLGVLQGSYLFWRLNLEGMAPKPLLPSLVLIIFTVRNLGSWNNWSHILKKHEHIIYFLTLKISS